MVRITNNTSNHTWMNMKSIELQMGTTNLPMVLAVWSNGSWVCVTLFQSARRSQEMFGSGLGFLVVWHITQYCHRKTPSPYYPRRSCSEESHMHSLCCCGVFLSQTWLITRTITILVCKNTKSSLNILLACLLCIPKFSMLPYLGRSSQI
jgi:hypothetical protein